MEKRRFNNTTLWKLLHTNWSSFFPTFPLIFAVVINVAMQYKVD